ncbi:MAG: dihydroorotase [Gemmatimonadetes bacterium]|nr:dihydroorotase [Gemmatimonadota bacterium]
MPHRTLIRGAQVVLPGEVARSSVLIEDGIIAGVDAAVHARTDEVVDAAGQYLLPGVIDDQVHFRDPGLTHKEDLRTGSRACAAGGVTSFLEMPNTVPQTITVEALAAKLDLASRRSVVNYGFYMGATTDNLDELCRADRSAGVATPGIKIFIGSSTGNMLVDDQECLEAIFAETTLPIAAHCEDEGTVRANQARLAGPLTIHDHSRIRDRRAAVTATLRAIDLAERHRHRFHVLHVSTADEVRIIAEHNRLGAPRDRVITAEACPHHLFFDTSDYDRLGTLAQMNPSLKTVADREALWRGLKEGAIQILATDHAPHTLEEKAVAYPGSPSGVPAVEVFLPLMLNEVNGGRCTLQDLAAWMCDRPARIWDIVGKGRIESGYDADLVLVDMEKEQMVRNEDQRCKSGWSPWHGSRLQGWPVRTWVGGRTVFADGRVATESLGREIVFDRERGGYWATGGAM